MIHRQRILTLTSAAALSLALGQAINGFRYGQRLSTLPRPPKSVPDFDSNPLPICDMHRHGLDI